MSMETVLRELWPAITPAQMQKVADAIVAVHGPIPTDDQNKPTMTPAAFAEAFIKRSIKDWLKAAVHRSRQAADQAAQAVVDQELGA